MQSLFAKATRLGIAICAALFLVIPVADASDLLSRVKGYILLQVEQHGESWYVRPATGERHYMANGDVAYEMMRSFGLGVTDADLTGIPAVDNLEDMLGSSSVCGSNALAARLSGEILLQVEQHGEAWYVYPLNCRRIYMQDGAAAYQIMRFLGLGITNVDLATIVRGPEVVVDTAEPGPDESADQALPTEGLFAIEIQVFNLVNAHRVSLGEEPLTWSNAIAELARQHSVNMADGTVERGHAGFSDRAEDLGTVFPDRISTSENVAWNNFADPGQAAFDWWLGSPGHKSNLEHETHNYTGIGVAKNEEGEYYFTQIFIAE